MITAGPADALQSLGDALAGSDITGWDVAAAGVVLVVGYPAGRLAARLTTKTMKKFPGFPEDLVNDAARVARWLVYLIALALAMTILGASVGFVSIILVLGLIVGALMLRPMIENSAAGMLLMARPSFSPGDQIETGDFRGVVEEIGSRSTVLRTSDGVRVHIPNQQVLGAPIQVFTAYDTRRSSIDVAVDLETDLDNATSVLMKAVTGVDDIASKPAPEVQASDMAGGAVTLQITYWYPSSMASGSSVTDGVIRAVMEALRKADITLSVPSLEVDSATTSAAGQPHGSDHN